MSNQTYSAYISGPLSKRKEFGIDILESAALDAGFSIVRRTNLASSSRLNQEIVNSLRKADIVLADITGNPAHVLYEVGFAQSLEKPVLFIAEQGSPTPFDLAAVRTITYDPNKPDSAVYLRIQSALQEMLEQIESGTSTSLAMALEAEAKRKSVFISYSHVDKDYLDRLLVHLAPLEHAGQLDLWVDTRINVGDRWKGAIEEALTSAAVVVVLASADYLASEFIRTNELPQMLLAAEQNGTRILPLILKPCRFARHSSLMHFQSLNDPKKPIAILQDVDRELFYDKLATEIERYTV